ncbi:chemotaxis protein CheC [Natronobacterium gregoryi]|uniref:Chemotaxis protein CheC n=2 Tax=Natronobacterium gregoryi TaxID=44930 RepID=L0AF58_NATGS|nr:chemotaxis protein CheC [Natronobacterium gregoryi]AFZ71767.1 chemotaxis protein CheC, inhibitor of MCP methylation [Natronobacterium gregoryi SP2]ELY72848.1 chemotaxis protein CheC [Natronobacterium gregoryi SP2]PLK21052.1 chemotaxis protein CheC [Natronobacterium gregoryi SP2]SFI88291.1 chemotaxis protein CheC [Natronobacterium gregoryi]
MTTKVDIRKLSFVNEMAKVGTNGVADNMSKLTGQHARMEVTKTNFVDVLDLERQLDDENRVGVRVRLQDPPRGHILILFPEESAKKITAIMLDDVVDDLTDVSGKMARSAVEEMGTMMANGFIDGWADVLGRVIDIAAPQLVYAPAGEVVTRTASLDGDDLALFFDSELTVPSYQIEAEIYAFPDVEAFVELVNDIDVKTT